MKILTTTIRACLTFAVALCFYAGGLLGMHQVNAQVTYIGNTSASPSWNAPSCPDAPANLATCVPSQNATAARFNADWLIIGTSGAYAISSTQSNSGTPWDGMLALYNQSFDPTNPTGNILGFNDDGTGGVGTSEIAVVLNNAHDNVAAAYRLVTTGFDNNAFGAYTTNVAGPAGALFLASDGTDLSGGLQASTASNPVWNRPACPAAGANPTDLSDCSIQTGLSPRFSTHNITPSCDGNFWFLSQQDYDGFLLLYEGSFDVNNPLQNLIAYNDDWTQIGNSAFLVRLEANKKYFYVNTGFDNNAAGNFSQLILGPQDCAVATSVEDNEAVPKTYELSQVYPNPFNPQARFTLRVDQPQRVSINVFDVLGRQVATLHEGPLPPGTQHPFTLDASTLPSGIYIIRAQGETFTDTRNAMLIK